MKTNVALTEEGIASLKDAAANAERAQKALRRVDEAAQKAGMQSTIERQSRVAEVFALTSIAQSLAVLTVAVLGQTDVEVDEPSA